MVKVRTLYTCTAERSSAYMLEKAGAYFAEVWLLFVVVLLQVSEKLLLEPVDVFDVAEDSLQLGLREHVRVLEALTDVALKVAPKRQTEVPLHMLTNRRCCKVLDMKHTQNVPYVTDVLQVLDVDAFSLQDLLDHVGPHLLLVLDVVGLPGAGVLLLVRHALHALRARVLLVHSHLQRNGLMSIRAPGF